MTYFSNNDYEIRIQDYRDDSYIALGSGDYCSVKFDGVGSPDLRDSVYDVSGADGVIFGTEYYGMVNWTITGAVHSGINGGVAGDSGAAWDAWSTLSRVWTQYPERLIPRAVKPLFFKRPGREQMVVYGRPARIDPETERSHAGFIAYTATFRQSDPLFYSSQQQMVQLGMDVPYAGGILLNAPKNALRLPFVTTEGAAKNALLNNTGDVPTSPIITFIGPVENPELTLTDQFSIRHWYVKINGTIPAGTSIIVDTRQWARSVTDSYGTSWAGAYVGDKLQDVKIPVGINTIGYQGIDQTGTSLCRVEFRNAWASL